MIQEMEALLEKQQQIEGDEVLTLTRKDLTDLTRSVTDLKAEIIKLMLDKKSKKSPTLIRDDVKSLKNVISIRN